MSTCSFWPKSHQQPMNRCRLAAFRKRYEAKGTYMRSYVYDARPTEPGFVYAKCMSNPWLAYVLIPPTNRVAILFHGISVSLWVSSIVETSVLPRYSIESYISDPSKACYFVNRLWEVAFAIRSIFEIFITFSRDLQEQCSSVLLFP